MKAWVVGLLLLMILGRFKLLRIKINGFLAVLFLAVVPYFLGVAILQLLGIP